MVTRPENDPSDLDPTQNAGSTGGWPGCPDRPHQYVSRARLLDLLDSDPDVALVLVSAPAGTGKTSLVADWVSTRATGRVDWVTFDPGDVLWPALVSALERLGIATPGAPVPPTDDTALDPGLRRDLALALASEPDPVTLVVDGYDLVSAPVAADLDFLLRHSGHRLRLVLVTRADPVLPLYRYRLEESLTDIRMADLALSDAEAATLLDGMGVHLTPASVHELNARTRGWVTGMRFASKLLRGHADPDADIGQVMGESGSIAEYLMGEVLATQTPQELELLMALSIPDSLEPRLARLLGGEGTDRVLPALSRVNVFLETVPERPDSYRFHPFFRDLLRAELRFRSPERFAELHRWAARWYAEEGMTTPAARHFAEVGAWAEVGGLVLDQDDWLELLLAHPAHPLSGLLGSVPAGVEAPTAVLVRATLALAEHDGPRFDREVAALDRATVADDLAREIEPARALLIALRARQADDPQEALRLADAAVEATRDRDGLVALALSTQAIARLRRGFFDEARTTLRAAAKAGERSGSATVRAECLGLLALIACTSGELGRAESWAARAAGVAQEAGLEVGDRPASVGVALAWIAIDRFDLRTAGDHLQAAGSSHSVLTDPVSRVLLGLVGARLRVAQGDRAGAITSLSDVIEELSDTDRWLVSRLRVELAAWLITRGDLAAGRAALDGLDDACLAPAIALVRAQIDLALGDQDGARVALAEARDPRAPIPVQVSATLAECARLLRAGSTSQARAVLADALVLARTPMLRRPFHEAAAAVRHLVQHDRQLSAEHAWLIDRSGATVARPPARPAPGPQERTAPVEHLTEKELEVLGHLAELLTTDEIAAQMYISVNTVRTHVRNILRKLGVSRRNAAVRIAREYELLPG